MNKKLLLIFVFLFLIGLPILYALPYNSDLTSPNVLFFQYYDNETVGIEVPIWTNTLNAFRINDTRYNGTVGYSGFIPKTASQSHLSIPYNYAYTGNLTYEFDIYIDATITNPGQQMWLYLGGDVDSEVWVNFYFGHPSVCGNAWGTYDGSGACLSPNHFLYLSQFEHIKLTTNTGSSTAQIQFTNYTDGTKSDWTIIPRTDTLTYPSTAELFMLKPYTNMGFSLDNLIIYKGNEVPPYTPPPPATSINITTNNDLNNTIISNTQPNFNFSIKSSYGNASCNLVINTSYYGYNASVKNNTETIIKTNASLNDGNYTAYILCNHSTTTGQSGNIYFGIDKLKIITINQLSPANNTFFNISNPTLYFNATSTNNALMNCSLLIDTIPFGTNKTIQNATLSSIKANATTTGGLRFWFVNCSDSLISNISATRTFYIDSLKPKTELTIKDYYATNEDTITLNYTYAEDYISNCSLYVNGILNQTDTTLTSDPNIIKNKKFQDDTNWTFIETNESYDGNFMNIGIYTTPFNRSYNISKPYDAGATIYFNPGDNAGINQLIDFTNISKIYIRIKTSINYDYHNNVSVYYNNTEILNTRLAGNLIATITLINYGVTGNQNLSFRMKYNNASIYSWTYGDTLLIDNIDVFEKNKNFTIPLSNNLNYSFICRDKAGNINTSETRNIIYDVNPPVISNINPTNNSKKSATYNISFSFTATETGSFLYSVNTNVSYSNGSLWFNLINYTDSGAMLGSLTETNTKYYYGDQNFNITYDVCDGHTANSEQFNKVVKAPIINKITNAIDFESITIKPLNNVVSSKVEKKTDRYSFSFDLIKEEKTEILLTSKYEKLKYYPNSKYKGHFIDPYKKIWIDFEEFPNIEVVKIDDYNYKIVVNPIIETKISKKGITITANSVGAMNCIRGMTTFNVSIDGLDIALYDYGTGANITNFNVTIGATTQQTNNGTIHFNLSINNYTAVYKSPGYSDKTENISLVGYTSVYSPMYKENSILIFVYDEDTGIIINNLEVLFDANTTYYENFITTNGSVYVSNLPNGFYDIRARSSNYVDRHYFATLNSNYALINAYLLNNSNAVILTIKSEATDKFIEGVLITLNRRINGTWSNVGSQYTDGVGSARFGMKEGETYSILLSAQGYDTKQISLTPFESAYTIFIQSENTQLFFTLFDKLSYSINPKVLVIPPYSYDNPITCFNLTLSSPGGYMDYFGLSTTFEGVLNSSNVTGSTTGGIAEFCLDLSTYNGYNLSVNYWIKATGESLYTGNSRYFILTSVYGSITPWANVSNSSMFGVLSNYKNQIPMTWKIIIMMFCAIGLMLVFAQFIPPFALGWIGIAVIGIFSYVWFQAYILIIMILVVVFAVLYMLIGGKE